IDRASLRNWAAGEMAVGESRVTQLNALLEKRTQLATLTDVDEDIADLDRQIEELRAAMKPTEVKTADEVQRVLLPPPPANTSLRDLARLAGLPDLLDAETPKQIEGDVE